MLYNENLRDLLAWEAAQRADDAAYEAVRQARRMEKKARRALEKFAVIQGLPAPPEKMPEWFQTNVDRFYNQSIFLGELKEHQSPVHKIAEDQMILKRASCRKCQEDGFRKRRR